MEPTLGRKGLFLCFFGSLCDGPVLHDGKHSSRVWGPWARCIYSQKAERDESCCSLYSVRPPAHGMALPIFKIGLLSQLTKSRSSLIVIPWWFGLVAVLNPIKLPIKINHQNPGINPVFSFTIGPFLRRDLVAPHSKMAHIMLEPVSFLGLSPSEKRRWLPG